MAGSIKKSGARLRQTQALPPGKPGIKPVQIDRKQEVAGLLLVGFSLLLFVAVLGFNNADENGLGRNLELIDNWLGVPGAFASWYLIHLMGYPSLVLPIVLCWIGVTIFRNWPLSEQILRLVLVFTLGILVAWFMALVDTTQTAFYYGTATALAVQGLSSFTGKIGCWGLWTILSLIWLRFAVNVSYNHVVNLFMRWSRKKSQDLKENIETSRQSRKFRKSMKQAVDDGFRQANRMLPEAPLDPEIVEEEVREVRSEPVPPEEPPSKPVSSVIKVEPSRQPPEEEPPPKRPVTFQHESEENIQIDELIVEEEIDFDRARKETLPDYKLPSVELLQLPPAEEISVDEDSLKEVAQELESALASFGVEGKVVHISPGPVITRYEVEPGYGVKVNKFVSLSDDLALRLKAQSIRIIAPIPGKAAVGIEIPNPRQQVVFIRSIINSEKFGKADSPLTIALGKKANGEIQVTDLRKMPHLLIAGATGAGKSVCINNIIASILFRARPDQVKFVMVDPKKIELSNYNPLKDYHLISSKDLDEFVITKPKNAVTILKMVEVEMDLRYGKLATLGVRNIEEYNTKVSKADFQAPQEGYSYDHMPYMVVIVDEFSDLMITAGKEVESSIIRLAQMARAVGIHLIIATQRPSVNVITGIIKANFPTRIAFRVASKTDSRTILDMNGAEKLLGRGDMLFIPPGSSAPVRIHNAFVSTEDTDNLIKYIATQPRREITETLPPVLDAQIDDGSVAGEGERDEFFEEALKLVIQQQQASASMLQRKLSLGYARASRLIDQLEMAGYIGPKDGAKPREVYASYNDL